MPKHLFLGIALLLGLVSNAQISAPKYSNEFLAIGVGARALAMSGSVVSSNQDLTAGYWNPAGLTGIAQDMQVGYMHADYFAGIAKFDYAGIAKRMDDESAASLSIMRFGVDDIPNTLDLLDAEGNIDYDRISVFSASDYAFVFSYAELARRRLDLGRFGQSDLPPVGWRCASLGLWLGCWSALQMAQLGPRTHGP